jgi:hypothetical protein
MSSGPGGKNWLERHPGKAIFLLIFLAVLCLAVVTEKLLAWKAGGRQHPGVAKRYIKLREFDPLYRDVLTPSPEALRIADSLEKKDFVIRVDEDGYIMPSRIHAAPDLTLIFLGGSTTENIYVEEENRFPYLAGRLLEKKTGLKTNSYNAGKSGNNSLHSIDVLLNKGLGLKPDIAVMMHNLNDLTILLYEKTYWNQHPTRSPLVEKRLSFKTVLKNLEETARMVRDLTIPQLAGQWRRLFRLNFKGPADEFKEARGRKLAFDEPLMVGEFSLNLQTFINLCRARGVIPVLMTQPSRLTANPDPLIANLMKNLEKQQGITYNEFRRGFDLFNQTIREVGARNRIPVIDLARQVPSTREYIIDVAHTNDRGSQFSAQLIAEALVPVARSLGRTPTGPH